jgi:flavin reductase (DIM6/NTAB) family NADH-FMN oxidoreductase RutF
MTVDQKAFRETMSCFASGVTVVTACTGAGAPVGLTVSAFSSLSLDPCLVLICLDKRVSNLDRFRDGPFAINILAQDQAGLSNRFASKLDDRFEGVAHNAGETGAPLLPDALAWVECETHEVLPGGDHDIIIGRVVACGRQADGVPLVYYRGGYRAVS